jgi:hypothetical protein
MAAQDSANLSDGKKLQPLKQPLVNKESGIHLGFPTGRRSRKPYEKYQFY